MTRRELLDLDRRLKKKPLTGEAKLLFKLLGFTICRGRPLVHLGIS